MQGIASNFNDPDLIPGNIKDQVDIFGVEGTFEGGIGTATAIEYLCNPNNYMIQSSEIYVPLPIGYHNDTNYVLVPCRASGGGYGSYYELVRIDKGATLKMYPAGYFEVQQNSTVGNSVDSVYIDGGYLYINFSDSRYDKCNISTGVRSGFTAGSYTSGTVIPSSSSIVLGEYTYAVGEIQMDSSVDKYTYYCNIHK